MCLSSVGTAAAAAAARVQRAGTPLLNRSRRGSAAAATNRLAVRVASRSTGASLRDFKVTNVQSFSTEN